MHFDIVRKVNVSKKSFRVAQLYDQFDLHENEYEEKFVGEIDLDCEWRIGVIVGKSGTGKSTIARELFPDNIYTPTYQAACVVDDFPKMESQKLFSILSSVGFNSPPSWLKPYCVLSNGEKMRVDLARAICEEMDVIVFDEFTSVVDREVAQLGSFALQKCIRKQNKKFIAVTCHSDVIDWLEPDWVFSADNMQYRYTRGLLRRPEIKIEIRKTRGMWPLFRRYHYLSHSINKAATEYTAFINDKPVAFCAYIYMPHQIGVLRRPHRLVCLPDYQGLGISKKILSFSANIERQKYKHISFTTSVKGFAQSLMREKNWRLTHSGRMSKHSRAALNKTSSNNRNTYSFKFVG